MTQEVKTIQVYDALNTKKIIPIAVQPNTTIQKICEQIDPKYILQDKTLYLDELELLWEWSIAYLEAHHGLKEGQKVSFLVRMYDLDQTCRVLQLEEDEVKELIAQKKVKAFSKGGVITFRKSDVDELRDSMMECPTMLIPHSQLQLEQLLAEQKAQPTKIKVFDGTNGSSTIIDYDPDKTVGEFCLEVNPASEKEDMTLFQNGIELDRNRLLSDLAENNKALLDKKFVVKFRFYTFAETLQKLGITESLLRRRVQIKELKAYSRKGEWVFKKRDIDTLILSAQ